MRALVDAPFPAGEGGAAPATPLAVFDRRGEGRALPLIVSLAGADGGVVAVVSDVPRRRGTFDSVLSPGRLGVEVAVLGGDRCDAAAMVARLALARGGPLLAMLDYRALAQVDLPADVHVVLVDPPLSEADVSALRAATAGRTVHLAWGDDEARHALRIAEDDLGVRETARAIWPALQADGGHHAWDASLTQMLAGDGAVSRSPRAVAIALAALRDAGLITVDAAGISVAPVGERADLDTTPTGLHAAALLDQARMLAGRAGTLDPFGHPSRTAGALS
jgi:hypothetical protein